jgi:hypothetical protein
MSSNEPGHWDFRIDNVCFYMTNGEQRVRCAITDRALEVLEPNFGRTEKGRLDAFEMHRAIIERTASAAFDHLVGAGEQRRWDVEAQHLRCPEVDDQFEFRRLLDWHVGRLGALD